MWNWLLVFGGTAVVGLVTLAYCMTHLYAKVDINQSTIAAQNTTLRQVAQVQDQIGESVQHLQVKFNTTCNEMNDKLQKQIQFNQKITSGLKQTNSRVGQLGLDFDRSKTSFLQWTESAESRMGRLQNNIQAIGDRQEGFERRQIGFNAEISHNLEGMRHRIGELRSDLNTNQLADTLTNPVNLLVRSGIKVFDGIFGGGVRNGERRIRE